MHTTGISVLAAAHPATGTHNQRQDHARGFGHAQISGSAVASLVVGILSMWALQTTVGGLVGLAAVGFGVRALRARGGPGTREVAVGGIVLGGSAAFVAAALLTIGFVLNGGWT